MISYLFQIQRIPNKHYLSYSELSLTYEIHSMISQLQKKNVNFSTLCIDDFALGLCSFSLQDEI
jgi:hypothetical protein